MSPQNCTRCGRARPEGSTFCGTCGAHFEGPGANGTMLGVSAPVARAASIEAPQFARKKTFLGIALPGIAREAAPANTEQKGTMLGVAIPGIAPVAPPFAPKERRHQQVDMPAVVPMPAPFVDEALPEIPLLVPKTGLPTWGVAAIIGGVLLVGVGLFALLWKVPPPLRASARFDPSGHELLHLTCETCPDETTATIRGGTNVERGTFSNHEADVPLDTPLSVGDNPLVVMLDRPANGRDEEVNIVVPVHFLVRPDVAESSRPYLDQPASLVLRIDAPPSAEVHIDHKLVPLDAEGHATTTVDVEGPETLGTSDGVKTVVRKVSYEIDVSPMPPETGESSFPWTVVPLRLDAPGLDAVTDASSFVVAGLTNPGTSVFVNRSAADVDKTGAFAISIAAPSVGDVPVEVRVYLPNAAPRTARFTVRRVKSLDAEANAVQEKKIAYDALARDIAAHSGEPTYVEGEIVESRAIEHQTVYLVNERYGCARGPCLFRVVSGASSRARRGEILRAFGRIAEAHTSAGKAVPELDADFVVRRR